MPAPVCASSALSRCRAARKRKALSPASGSGDEEALHLCVEISVIRDVWAFLFSVSAALAIDAYAVHARQIDHQAAVADRVAGDTVPAVAHRHEEPVVRAKFTDWITSATPRQQAISAGRRSITPFQPGSGSTASLCRVKVS